MCAKPRAGRRRTRTLRQRLQRVLLVAFALAAPALLVLGGLRLKRSLHPADWFPLKSWTVVGADRADGTRLRERLDGLLGKPLASIDGPALAAELVAGDAWIENARIVPLWPGALRVDVLERRPVAWLAGPRGLTCLSAEGRLLPAPSGGRPLDLPLLDRDPSLASKRIDETLADAGRALDWMRTSHPALFARIERVQWGEEPRLALEGNAPSIRLKRSSWKHGISMLEALRAERPGLLVEGGGLDLRFTNQVIRRRNDV